MRRLSLLIIGTLRSGNITQSVHAANLFFRGPISENTRVQNYDTPSMPGSVSISMPETWRDTGHKGLMPGVTPFPATDLDDIIDTVYLPLSRETIRYEDSGLERLEPQSRSNTCCADARRPSWLVLKLVPAVFQKYLVEPKPKHEQNW